MSWRTLDGGVHILDLAEMAGLDRAAGVVSTRRGGVSKPRDVMAAFGPAICPKHYTVGAEVVEALDETRPAGLTAPYVSVGEGSYALDLWEANSARLEASGLPSNQIHVARICTFEDGDRFYSHRRSGAATGRVAACIMLRD